MQKKKNNQACTADSQTGKLYLSAIKIKVQQHMLLCKDINMLKLKLKLNQTLY